METILTILFLVAAAIIHSFMKKKEEKDAGTWLDDVRPGGERKPPVSRPTASRPARPQPTNWEAELRRFLEGESAPQPPPILRREPTPPAVETVVVHVPAPAPPPLVMQPPPAQTVAYESDEGPGLPVHMPSLAESAQAFQRASQIESRVEEHLRQTVQHVSLHTKSVRERPSGLGLHDALALLRTPQSLRTAVVVSVVLGPPKAMEL
jgi:hypothetical protein